MHPEHALGDLPLGLVLNRQKQLPALIREPGTMNGGEYRHKQEKLSVIASTWANDGWLGC